MTPGSPRVDRPWFSRWNLRYDELPSNCAWFLRLKLKYGELRSFFAINVYLRRYIAELETYVEIPSDNVPFNQAPLMKAREITAAGKEALRSGKYDVVRINYANPDMAGWSLKATTRMLT